MPDADPPPPCAGDNTFHFSSVGFRAVLPDREDEAEMRKHRARNRQNWLPPAMILPHWEVLETFTFKSCAMPEAAEVEVPAGFTFDGASTPWPFTIFVPKTHPIYLPAAAVHDYLYTHQQPGQSRGEADELFLDALLMSGLHWFWAWIMWRATRAGGWLHWYRRHDTPIGRFLKNGPGYLVWPVRIVVTFVMALSIGLVLGILRLPHLREHYRVICRMDRRDDDPEGAQISGEIAPH